MPAGRKSREANPKPKAVDGQYRRAKALQQRHRHAGSRQDRSFLLCFPNSLRMRENASQGL